MRAIATLVASILLVACTGDSPPAAVEGDRPAASAIDPGNWPLQQNVFERKPNEEAAIRELLERMQVTGAVIDPVTGQSTLTNTNAGGATIQGLEFESETTMGLVTLRWLLAASLLLQCFTRRSFLTTRSCRLLRIRS